MITESTCFEGGSESAFVDELPPRPWATPANLMPPAGKPISMMDEAGEFLLSYYGAQMALGFKGPLDFIHRCYNWAENTGVIGKNATLHWFYDQDGKLGYVCPPTKEHIRKGLIAQFRTEIIQAKTIPLLKNEWSEETGLDIEYDEVAIEHLAAQKAEEFLQTKIRHDMFLANDPKSVAPIYDYSPPVHRLGSQD